MVSIDKSVQMCYYKYRRERGFDRHKEMLRCIRLSSDSLPGLFAGHFLCKAGILDFGQRPRNPFSCDQGPKYAWIRSIFAP